MNYNVTLWCRELTLLHYNPFTQDSGPILTAGRRGCMFWLESAIVARYTKFLCSICWYLCRWTVVNTGFKFIWVNIKWTQEGGGVPPWLTVNILPFCLYFGSPLYTGWAGCFRQVTATSKLRDLTRVYIVREFTQFTIRGTGPFCMTPPLDSTRLFCRHLKTTGRMRRFTKRTVRFFLTKDESR